MTKQRGRSRQIALFVEGDTETALPAFFHRWLDPQLSEKVGIRAVKFKGVSNYLDDFAQKLEFQIERGGADFVFGLVDLYGLPPSRIDLRNASTVREKVAAARREIRQMIPDGLGSSFRQHFAVHEVEAWLLAYPQKFPAGVRDQITKRPPETVDFDEPPAKFLKRILRGRYEKTVYAKNIFPFVDPQVAINNCPYLGALAEDLLAVATRLQ